MKNLLVMLIPIIFLFSCTNEQSSEPHESSKAQTQIGIEEGTNLKHYFLKDNSTAKFKGVGNEYATFTLKTHYLYDNYVATYEDNGGTVTRRYYKISPTQITLINEQSEAYEEANPSLEELKTMEDISVYLELPLEVGNEFNGWRITSATTTVETDLQTFENVIVLEKIDEQGNLMRKYFAEDYGEIQRDYVSNTSEDPFTVSSVIEYIK
ncbi:hypothetical protein KD050_20465 [Psychrobacillus sp. INOP01]|uniref:hypothetical protein n=1 Tax=Psychrobacillus sp. INOP01 TaxID=2829187 RepID=UPI001BABCB27|nr:hypothetical protein [Psychrobacillus sp. INOP01]QUG41610.1 hypothetical protein KD050_20465 [Psychrobacillus sp. INOP01]